MEILAIETKYSSYFNKLICETDILVRLQPLMRKVDAVAKPGMTPEAKREAEAGQTALWRGILSALPAAYQPPFTATEFFLAIHDGQMERRRLAEIVAGDTSVICPNQLQGLHPDPAVRPERLKKFIAAMIMRLERFDRLPDLLNVAHASGVHDAYAEQERLAREYEALKKLYRTSTPYRQPPRLRRSAGHKVPAVKYTLVDPARNTRAELWAAELHEARGHGAALPAAVSEFLERLADPD